MKEDFILNSPLYLSMKLQLNDLNHKLHQLNVEYNAEKTLFEHTKLCNKSLRNRLNLSATFNLIFIVLIIIKFF